MSHNDFSRPGGLWPPTLVPTARDLQWWDELSTESVNGDDGGTWAPVTPVRIGGSGIITTTAPTSIDGGVFTYKGGRAQLGNNDYPVFTSAQSRDIVMQFDNVRPAIGAVYNYEVSLSPRGIQMAYSTGAFNYIPVPGRCIHTGATLTTVEVTIRIAQPHAAVPANQPAFGLFRADSGRVFALQSLYSGTTVALAAGSADAYFDLGAPQIITLTCDQNNVVDATNYVYLLKFFDENGANSFASSLNVWCSAKFRYVNTITDMRFE